MYLSLTLPLTSIFFPFLLAFRVDKWVILSETLSVVAIDTSHLSRADVSYTIYFGLLAIFFYNICLIHIQTLCSSKILC